MVCGARLAGAPVPAGDGGGVRRAGFNAADRANRRRQNALRLPAAADRHPRDARAGHSYGLCLAAEGAHQRHRAQSDAAHRGDGASGGGRKPHGRYAARQARPPAPGAPQRVPHHAGKPDADAFGVRCATALFELARRDRGRGPQLRRQQARRFHRLGPLPPVGARPASRAHRAFRHRRRSGGPRRLAWPNRRTRARAAIGPALQAGYPHPRARRCEHPLWRLHGALCRARNLRGDPQRRHVHRLREHARASRADAANAVGRERG